MRPFSILVVIITRGLNMRIYTFLAAVSVSALISCSSAPFFTMSNAYGLTKSDMAIIKFDTAVNPEYWPTSFLSVRDLELDSSTKTGNVDSVHVAPGRYDLLLVTSKYPYTGYPRVTINARAGKTYLVHCISIGDGKVAAFSKETETPSDKTLETSSDRAADH